MTEKIRTYDLFMQKVKELEEAKASLKPQITQKRFDTLHRRDIDAVHFYHVARFIHALLKVRVTGSGIPEVIFLGETEIRLPVWYKSGDGWKLSTYRYFRKESVAVTVPMMGAIEKHLNLKECVIIDSLFNLSMIAVDRTTGTFDKRRYRQICSGRLINPVDGTFLNFRPVENIEAFVLDWKRVRQWIDKELAKRAKRAATVAESK